MLKICKQPFRLLVHKRNLEGKSKHVQAIESKVGIQFRIAPAAQLHDFLQPALEIPGAGKKPMV